MGGHFHNTRNTGYANALAALEAGATVLDASVGGLGGCPFAPRATGNVATEDLVYLLHGEGVETGIDLEALIAVTEWLEEILGRGSRGRSIARGRSLRARAPEPARARAGLAARREDGSAHLPERDLSGSSPEDELVSVLQERPRAPVAEPDRASAVPRELDERALATPLGAGDRARGEEVARSRARRR